MRRVLYSDGNSLSQVESEILEAGRASLYTVIEEMKTAERQRLLMVNEFLRK